MGGRFVCSVLIMFILAVSILSISIDTAEGTGHIVVTVQFKPGEEEQEADVRPGETGQVTFRGTVEASMPAGGSAQDVIVTLNGYTENNWPVVINPEEITVNPKDGRKLFYSTVTVPPEASVYNADTLTIEGTVKAFPGSDQTYDVQPVTGSIRIKQFYKYSLYSEDEAKSANTGEHVSYTLEIFNHGNGADKFLIDVFNKELIESDGFTVEISTPSIVIEEKSSDNVSIRVDISDDKKSAGKYTIEVSVESYGYSYIEGVEHKKHYPLHLTVHDNTNLITVLDDYTSLIITSVIVIVIIILVLIRNKRRKSRLNSDYEERVLR